MSRILIVGGYGAFGARVAERLAREPELTLIIAGRSGERARAHATALAGGARARVEHAGLDAMAATPEALQALAPAVLINASGPFQAQDYALPRAAIASGCHYIDLADARAYVTGITALDSEARAANVSVISGASSVPGVSSAVVQRMAAGLAQLDEVHIGISPGNSFDPGVATALSTVGQAGKPFPLLRDGRQTIAYCWQGLHRYRFPELGARLMSAFDVPDLELLPQRYPGLRTARFAAGLELAMFNLGLAAAALMVRTGLMRDLRPIAAPMLAMKRRLSFLGSDKGGMFVRVAGRNHAGARQEGVWHLIARSGHGPYVPAIASVILAKRLAAGAALPRGAMPCFGLFSLADFEAEIADLDITCTLDRAT